MKTAFKLIIIFFCLWSGLYSIIHVARGGETFLEVLFYEIVFALFVGIPAVKYWSIQIDEVFEKNDPEQTN